MEAQLDDNAYYVLREAVPKDHLQVCITTIMNRVLTNAQVVMRRCMHRITNMTQKRLACI